MSEPRIFCAHCGETLKTGPAPSYSLVHWAADDRRCQLFAEAS